MEDSSSPACAFHNVGEGGIKQLEDSSSPACAFHNVGEGGNRQLKDSSNPASVFYNVGEGGILIFIKAVGRQFKSCMCIPQCRRRWY